jgi:hypothetical protein
MSASPGNAKHTGILFKRWIHSCVLVPKRLFGLKPPIVPLPVVVRAGREVFESTLSSQSPDDYVLVVPKEYLRALALEAGDKISLILEPDLGRTAPDLPAEAARYLREAGLLEEYRRMTIASQRQTVKYLLGVANELGRMNRLEVTAERLRARRANALKRAKHA